MQNEHSVSFPTEGKFTDVTGRKTRRLLFVVVSSHITCQRYSRPHIGRYGRVSDNPIENQLYI